MGKHPPYKTRWDLLGSWQIGVHYAAFLSLSINSLDAHADPILITAIPSAAKLLISLSASIRSSKSVCSTIIDPDPTLTSTLSGVLNRTFALESLRRAAVLRYINQPTKSDILGISRIGIRVPDVADGLYART
jgi:hypothetical protein